VSAADLRCMSSGTWKYLAAAVIAAAVLAPSAAVAAPARSSGQVVAVASLEAGVLAEMNAVRRSHGLAPLRLSPALAAAARQHNQSMAGDGYFTHESADGSEFWKRVQTFYRQGKTHYWSVGENMLWSSPDIDARGALDMWMNSPPHRQNLLEPRWRDVGISAVHAIGAPGTYEGLDVTIVTADFGVRR
jgi:uncharacterized protein YkwD